LLLNNAKGDKIMLQRFRHHLLQIASTRAFIAALAIAGGAGGFAAGNAEGAPIREQCDIFNPCPTPKPKPPAATYCCGGYGVGYGYKNGVRYITRVDGWRCRSVASNEHCAGGVRVTCNGWALETLSPSGDLACTN
jgi:hypothetical protein